MEMGLFDALAMVALRVGQTKKSLLEKGTASCQQLGLQKFAERAETHSFPFQNANAMFCRPCVSQTPAMPSSPHL